MKNITKIFMLLALVICQGLNAQPWIENLKSENPTFQEIQQSFNDYWEGKPIEKGKGIKPFKRWEWFWESRLLANGEFPSPSINLDEYNKYIKTHPNSSKKDITACNWAFMGPLSTPSGYNGLGRINCIAFHPTNANTFWVGTPAGGLWKTTDGGTTWTTNTDDLPVLGVSDIAIDPTNANTMYIATGDGDRGSLSAVYGSFAGDTKSLGVFKSIDGGATWNTTGLSWNINYGRLIRRLIINPNDPQILLAATSDGIWRTINGGSNWTKVQTGYFMDIEFKPTDPSVIYASTYYNSEIFRSTDSGAGFVSVATITGAIRIDLAVSPNYPTIVQAVCSESSGGLLGLWSSTNSGASFSQYFTGTSSNNLLNCSDDASGTGGQGYYDLALAINPTNANDIWLGGVNTWNSTDGGVNWSLKTYAHPFSINGCGTNPGVATVHADKHFIAFHPLVSGTMFECNDGGIYKTSNNGLTWTDLSNGLGISQLYRIGVSQTVANEVICGLQDNGSRELKSGSWFERTGGDGMECIIDYTNASTQYASYVRGKLYRAYNSWTTGYTTISANIPGGQPTGAWLTPFVIDPTNPNILYAGYDILYKTIDQGNTWTAISPILSNFKLRSVAVAPSNSNTIYAAASDSLFYTHDGGNNWTKIKLTTVFSQISGITVDPFNAQKVFVSCSGYSVGNKVFMSNDGGVNWSNYSLTLPNVAINCITYHKGSNDGLYIGTDIGVFYIDSTLTDWIPYQTGLPNVVVTDLEISYNNNKLWAATYGRGLWNTDLFLTTSVNETEKFKNDVNIYPNPASTQLIIETKIYIKGITILNITGEIVKSVTSKSNIIDVTDLSNGIYFIKVNTDEGVITKKFIKE